MFVLEILSFLMLYPLGISFEPDFSSYFCIYIQFIVYYIVALFRDHVIPISSRQLFTTSLRIPSPSQLQTNQNFISSRNFDAFRQTTLCTDHLMFGHCESRRIYSVASAPQDSSTCIPRCIYCDGHDWALREKTVERVGVNSF